MVTKLVGAISQVLQPLKKLKIQDSNNLSEKLVAGLGVSSNESNSTSLRFPSGDATMCKAIGFMQREAGSLRRPMK